MTGSSDNSTTTYRQLLAAQFHTNGGAKDWLVETKEKAFARFQKLGLPTQKSESWKYIQLNNLLDSPLSVSKKSKEPFLVGKDVESYILSKQNRCVLVNGIFSEKYSSKPAIGFTFEKINPKDNPVQNYLSANADKEWNAFASINTFSFEEAVLVRVADNAVLPSSINIMLVSVSPESMKLVSYPRVLFILGKNAKANVILNHIGMVQDSHFMDGVFEAYLGENSNLHCTSVHRSDDLSSQFLSSRFYLDKYSSLDAVYFNQGGNLTRNEAWVDFRGEQATAAVTGLSILRGESQVFNHVTANHNVPNCTSRQFFKNILSDKAKAEFNSMVFVEKNAQKSLSNQLSRNLLLSDQAQCWARPQLRIDNDDVSCAHGATVGQLDEQELFYLRSRGLNEKEARFILTFGFAEEILEKIEDESLRKELEAIVRVCLQK